MGGDVTVASAQYCYLDCEEIRPSGNGRYRSISPARAARQPSRKLLWLSIFQHFGCSIAAHL